MEEKPWIVALAERGNRRAGEEARLHRLLERQISRAGVDELPDPGEPWLQLLAAVDRAYVANDRDRYLNERSLRVSSKELRSLYDELQDRAQTQLASLRDRFEAIVASLGAGLVVVTGDEVVDFANQPAAAMLGYSVEELEGRNFFALTGLSPDTFDEGHPNEFGYAALLRTASGTSLPVVCTARTNEQHETIIVFIDQSTRYRAEVALRRSEERYVLAAEGANDGLWDWDISRGTMYFSPRWEAMIGHTHPLPHVPETWFDRLHPHDEQHVIVALSDHIEGRTKHFEAEYRIEYNGGGWRWMMARGMARRPSPGQKATRFCGSQTDIHKRKSLESRLRFDAEHDGLTGLVNRTVLIRDMRRMCDAMSTGHRTTPFALLFFDIDRFKLINDTHGHAVGDQFLCAVAERMQANSPADSLVARHGGDEFAVLLREVKDSDEAMLVANAMRDSMRSVFEIHTDTEAGNHEFFASASIGVVVAEGSEWTADSVLRDADTALYRAKSDGRDRVVLFDSTLHRLTRQRFELANELERAIADGAFSLRYQPIYDLTNNTVTALEALIRWQHPTRGLLQPGVFMSIAEDSGRVAELGAMVIDEVCRQAGEWIRRESGPTPRITFNLSAREFEREDLVSQIKRNFSQWLIDGRAIGIELTETTAMSTHPAVARNLAAIRALGVPVYIDDFGTGHSSLATLQRFAYDTLKIDRSFVTGVNRREENMTILRAIVAMAQSLGMKVVAEGVETEIEREFVLSAGCHLAQGFLFARPMTAENAETLIFGETRHHTGSRPAAIRTDELPTLDEDSITLTSD